jgi:hypothetical protein
LGEFVGYETGILYRSGVIGSGYFTEDSDEFNRGLTLLFRLVDGTLQEFVWAAAPGNTLDPDDYDDPTAHVVAIYGLDGSSSSTLCARNDFLVDDDDDNNDDDDNSLASVLQVSIVVLLTVQLFLW